MDDAAATAEISALLRSAGIEANMDLVERILATGLALGTDGTDRLDLKITASALAEMRDAFRMFAPYDDRPKATIFGSARTAADDPLYAQTKAVAAALAAEGWMVVTGAGLFKLGQDVDEIVLNVLDPLGVAALGQCSLGLVLGQPARLKPRENTDQSITVGRFRRLVEAGFLGLDRGKPTD